MYWYLQVKTFAAVLRAHKGAVVWSDISDPWLADYLGFVFGWDVRLVNIGTSRDILDFKIPQPALESPPEFVFTENRRGGFRGGDRVRNTELTLLRMDGLGASLLDIDNPNGLEGSSDAPFFWLGTQSAKLLVLSSAGGRSLLSGRFTIGPSNPALREVDLTVASDASLVPQHLKVRPGQQQFVVYTRPGLNHFTLKVENPAVRFLPADPRPLLLRVDELRFQHEAVIRAVPGSK